MENSVAKKWSASSIRMENHQVHKGPQLSLSGRLVGDIWRILGLAESDRVFRCSRSEDDTLLICSQVLAWE